MFSGGKGGVTNNTLPFLMGCAGVAGMGFLAMKAMSLKK